MKEVSRFVCAWAKSRDKFQFGTEFAVTWNFMAVIQRVCPQEFKPSDGKDLTGRLAWSRRSTVGVGPTPYKWLLPELDLHLSRERVTLAPFSRISGVGRSGLWPPLHCGDSKHLHRRLFPAPHCTLRLSHLSVGGNARGPEIVSQLDM